MGFLTSVVRQNSVGGGDPAIAKDCAIICKASGTHGNVSLLAPKIVANN
jgi:hypothetical protein